MQSEAEAEAYIEALQDLDGLRLDVNRASQRDLLALPGLTPDLAWRITAFRPYQTLADLNRVPGLSADYLDAMAPYLSVTSPKRWCGRSTVRLSYSPSQKSTRLYQRHEIAIPNRLSALVLTERDPGEPTWCDFLSGYLQIHTSKHRITLGDLRPAFGQGLTLSRRTRSATGLSWATSRSTDRVGNRAAEEAGVLRGALLSGQYRWLSWNALFAQTQWDAGIDRAGLYRIYRSGLHDSETSRTRRGALRERIAALHMVLKSGNRTVGFTALKSRFTPQHPSASSLRQIAADAHWRTERFSLFGEAAFTPEDHAYLLGGILRFADFRVHIIGRRYGPQFHSLRGNAFAAYGGPPTNEWGAFVGASWRLNRRTRLELSLDRHGRIAPEDLPLPKRGERVRLRLHRRLKPRTALRFTADFSAESDRKARRGTRLDVSQSQGPMRLNLWAACRQTDVLARAAGLRLQMGTSKGLSLAIWATHFSVPNYDARLYAFEPDVWGGSRIIVLSKRGYASGARATAAIGPFRLALRYSLKHAAGKRQSSWAAQLDLQR